MSKVYLNLVATLRQLTNREEGASLAEYGLLLALIAVVAMGAVEVLGTGIEATFTEIAAAFGG